MTQGKDSLKQLEEKHKMAARRYTMERQMRPPLSTLEVTQTNWAFPKP